MEYLLMILFGGFIGSMAYIVFELSRHMSTRHKKPEKHSGGR